MAGMVFLSDGWAVALEMESMAEKKYTFVNGSERTENLNYMELLAIIEDIVFHNDVSSFFWNNDQTELSCG